MKLEYAVKSLSVNGDVNKAACAQMVQNDWACFVLANGLGAKADSTLASSLFCESAIQQAHQLALSMPWRPHETMQLLIDNATQKTLDGLEKAKKKSGRAVASLFWLTPVRIISGHIGDARVYLFDDEQVYWHSHDHSLAQQFVDIGLIVESEMPNHPMQNVLLRSIGFGEDPVADIVALPSMRLGQVVLNCNSGFWELITDDDLFRLARAESLQSELEALIVELEERQIFVDDIVVQACRLMG